MFLPIEMQSVNAVSQLLAGDYVATRRTYASRDRSTTMLQFEYRLSDAEQVAACDVLFVEGDGAVRACDFLRMPDRSWRDCFGARADSLLALLPRDVGDFILLDETPQGTVYVGDAK